MSLNTVTLSGVLARDPSMRYVQNVAETKLDVVCTSYESSGNEWKTVQTTIPVFVFGKSAERVAGWFKEGYLVEVEGRLKGFKVQANTGTLTVCAVLAKRVDSVKQKGASADGR